MEQLSIINAEHHEPFVAPKTKVRTAKGTKGYTSL